MPEPQLVRFIAVMYDCEHSGLPGYWQGTLTCMEGPTAMCAARPETMRKLYRVLQEMMEGRRPMVDVAEVAWVKTADHQLFQSLGNLTADLWERVQAAHNNGATVKVELARREVG
jgi:hypothetical protein